MWRGLLVAGNAAATALIEKAESELRIGETLFGCQFVQVRRLMVALRKAATTQLEENAENARPVEFRACRRR